MCTESRNLWTGCRPSRIAGALPGALVLVMAGTPSRAAKVEFLPAADTSLRFDGNVAVVGNQNVSDEVVEVGLDLSLVAITRASMFRFSYRPRQEFYRQFSSLDNTGHSLSVILERSLSPRSSFSMALIGAHTQQQVFRVDQPNLPASLVPRTTIDQASLDLGARIATGRRSFATWSLDGGLQRFESGLQDSSRAGASVGSGFRIAERGSLGVSYRYQHLGFESSPTTRVHALELSGDRQLGPNLAAVYRLGPLRAEDDSGDATIEPSVDVLLTWATPWSGSVVLGLKETVSVGTGLSSATQDRGGYLAWQGTGTGRFTMSATAGYGLHEPLDLGDQPATELSTLITSATATWRVGSHVDLGLFHSFADQEPRQETTSALSTRYNTAGGFLRWRLDSRRR